MVGKSADARKEGAAGTTKSATHYIRAKRHGRRRRAVERNLGFWVGARIG